MKIGELIHDSEEVAAMLVRHEEDACRKQGLWDTDMTRTIKDHDFVMRNDLFEGFRYKYFYWYVSMMRRCHGGVMCETPNCPNRADLFDVHHSDPYFICGWCRETDRGRSMMCEGPVASRTRKRKAEVEVDAEMVPLWMVRMMRHR